MKCTIIAFGCLLLAGPALAQSVGEKTGVNSTLCISPKTADFVKEVATSDMFEIQSIGGELNKADTRGAYKAMDRAGAIRVFNHDVVDKLRSSTTVPVNISHVFFYDYDSGGKSPKCDHIKYSWTKDLPGWCVDGVINPLTGNLLPDVAAAVAGQ